MRKNVLFIAVLALLPWAGILADPTVVTTESELVNAVQTNNANIQFGSNITVAAHVTISKVVTINLNGYTMRGNNAKLPTASDYKCLFIVAPEGNLTLSNGTLAHTDNRSAEINNRSIGRNHSAGALVNKGTATLEQVVIDDCMGQEGGAIRNLGNLTLINDSLYDNTAQDGGAIYNDEGATLAITGGVISGNSAIRFGGGAITNKGTLSLNGVTITGNTSFGNGGGVWNHGTLNMQGENTITGNTFYDGLANNLHLASSYRLTIAGSLSGSHIGVTAEDLSTAFTTGGSFTDVSELSMFSVDKSDFQELAVAEGNAALQKKNLGNTVKFINRAWQNGHVVASVETWEDGTYDYLTSATEDFSKDRYVVSGDVSCNGLSLGGAKKSECHVVLLDGAHLQAEGISVNASSKNLTLHFYAEEGGGTLGKLTSNASVVDLAKPGIGNYDAHSAGNFYFHGGDIYAYGSTGAAGIGGTHSYDTEAGEIAIYGGEVKAVGGIGGAGIGGGDEQWNYGTVNIYGGVVNATGGGLPGGAGIGGGSMSQGGTVHIYGGVVTAKGGHEAAAIGCGQYAEIGGPGTITIDGGHVLANGDDFAAGIGGGDGIKGATVTINGGWVEAYGGTDAAGIGGGEEGDGGTLTVNGGFVFAQGNDNGAGIGGGEDGDGANVTINGGVVVAYAGTQGSEEEGNRAIGPGDGSDNYGSLTFDDAMMVQAGYDYDQYERIFSAARRKEACWYRTAARIEVCQHTGNKTYTVDGTTADDHHIMHCEYCQHEEAELHHFDENNICTVCGVHESVVNARMYDPQEQQGGTFDGETYELSSTQQIVPSTSYTLPFGSVEVPGLTFLGWEASTTVSGDTYTSPYTTATADTLYRPGNRYLMTANTSFLARYQAGDLTIYDDGYNGGKLAEYDGMMVAEATLADRTLAKDNTWQTIALPFSLSTAQIANSPLAGCELKQLDVDGYYDNAYNRYTERAEGRDSTHYNIATNTAYLYFKDTTAIAAGRSYVVRWSSGNDTINPVFGDVRITNVRNNVSRSLVSLISLYSHIWFDQKEPTVIYLGANNTFLQPDGKSTITIGACRGYFRLHKFLLGGSSETPLTVITNLKDAVVPTDVESIGVGESQWQKVLRKGIIFIERDGKLYNINGQRVK